MTLPMSNLDIFPLISPCDIVSINKLTIILTIICQYYIKHIMIKKIKAILTFSLWSHHVILSVSTNWLWYWQLSTSVTLDTLWGHKNNNTNFEGLDIHLHYQLLLFYIYWIYDKIVLLPLQYISMNHNFTENLVSYKKKNNREFLSLSIKNIGVVVAVIAW